YQSIMGTNPSRFKGDNLPVECVNWNEAVKFCEKLTERERTTGSLPSGYEYRLPTEAEWEFAARGGNKSKGYKYSGNNNINSVAWYKDNAGEKAHEVGTKLPNELGIYDMSGNIYEWCFDDWHSSYNGAPSNGNRWGNGIGPNRRLPRGGGWYRHAKDCRVANRGNYSAGNTLVDLGFRVALISSLK
ncbi:MAG: SUMF1/EgtB/PvdO family nonheme iron enzyme, partial [Victivallales bacterium]